MSLCMDPCRHEYDVRVRIPDERLFLPRQHALGHPRRTITIVDCELRLSSRIRSARACLGMFRVQFNYIYNLPLSSR